MCSFIGEIRSVNGSGFEGSHDCQVGAYGNVEWCATDQIPRGDIGSVGEQQLHGGFMAALHCFVQRSPPHPILVVDRHSTLQSETDHGLIATGGCPVDRTGAMFVLEGDFVEKRGETEQETTARASERAEVARMVEILDDDEKELVGEGEDLGGGGGGDGDGGGSGGSGNGVGVGVGVDVGVGVGVGCGRRGLVAAIQPC